MADASAALRLSRSCAYSDCKNSCVSLEPAAYAPDAKVEPPAPPPSEPPALMRRPMTCS